MGTNYSFLKDEAVVQEIHRHKWIESEKSGREIGFATAAYDWITKYGKEWMQRHIPPKNNNSFIEKRKHKRFYHQLPILLRINNDYLQTKTADINLIGLSCLISIYVEKNSPIEASLTLPPERFRFKSRVLRSSSLKTDETNFSYHIFFPFDENLHTYLKRNQDVLTQSYN